MRVEVVDMEGKIKWYPTNGVMYVDPRYIEEFNNQPDPPDEEAIIFY